LIELLVVLAIIGLLMTLLVPTITSAQRQVQRLQTGSIIKNLSVGLEDFKKDFGDYPPSRPSYYFGGSIQPPAPFKVLAGEKDVARGDMGTGAANLIYYLAGPDRTGWGTNAGGTMPFGGAPQRTYGPYYQCEEEGVRYETVNVRGVQRYTPVGFLDVYKPAGVILYLKSYKREMLDSVGNKFVIQAYDPSDGNRPDVPDVGNNLRHPNYSKYNYGATATKDQQTMFDYAVGVWSRTGTRRAEIKRYSSQNYMLISPGPDHRYGYVHAATLEACDPDSDSNPKSADSALCDDIANWEK
jgi:type II secretory pathway pseudopilin PulG